MSYDYDVFFSYRHKPLDSQITEKLFNLIESYKLPDSLRNKGYEGVKRAFRDTEELSVSRVLTATIDNALQNTNCLIVVCSTDTPFSEWVDREVVVFIERGRAGHIYPLLINGDPETSFPPSLKKIPGIEKRTLDIRTPGNPVKKMLAKAETELLRVIADVAGCPEDELLREHRLRRNRNLVVRTAAAAAGFFAVGCVSFLLMRQAQLYRDDAAAHERASMEILNTLTYELPDRLTNIPGAYGKIAGLLKENTEDINRIIRLSRDKEYAEYEAAANYEKLANASSVLGSYEDALNAEEQAIGIYRELVESGYSKGRAALASAFNNKATIYHTSGNYGSAAASYTEALDAMHETDVDPVVLARTWGNAGANAVSMGDTAYAAECFEKSISVLDGTEKTADAIAAAAETNYNYGVLLYRSGQYDRAEERLNTAAEECRLLPETLLNRRSLVQTLSVLAACYMDQGRFSEADERYLQAESAAEIFALDTENLNNQLMVGNLYNNHGLCWNIQGNYTEADRYYALASEHYRHLSGSPSGTAVYAVSLLNRGENAFKAGTMEASRAFFEEGLQLYAPVCTELGSYHTAQYYAWLSYYELIHLRDYRAALSDARTAVDTQPDHVLANLNLAYACLYSGDYAECDRLFGILASLGEGQAETIRVDLEAQQNAGMESEHIPAVLEIIGKK